MYSLSCSKKEINRKLINEDVFCLQSLEILSFPNMFLGSLATLTLQEIFKLSVA